MKLLDARRIINANAALDAAQSPQRYVLATGFTPLALETYLHAHLIERQSQRQVHVTSGRFGDLAGNLERAVAERPAGVAVVMEWSDVDPRLGLRGHGAVSAPGAAEDVLATAATSLERLLQRIAALAQTTPVAVCLPTLPLPPYFLDLPHVAGKARLRLDALLADFAVRAADIARVRLIDVERLDAESPAATRWDAPSELATGFPYERGHAERVANALAAALVPAARKKGLVTDLDDTLWRGILGEVGVDGVSWGLDAHAHVHSLYQQCLANLVDSGVLVAVASKNDLSLVNQALAREDLLVRPAQLFPVHASWQPKSAAVAAVLQTWNVGADSIVFVDDSPLELAEVSAAHPGVECLRFEPNSPVSVLALLRRLTDLFGTEEVREEDRIRAESIRNAAQMRDAVAGDAGDSDELLATLDATVELVFSRDVTDGRALELTNKTNQFNLNGRRYTDADWAAALESPDAFLLTVAYRDRFGPLGRIAAAVGRVDGRELQVASWVLSCRAFARRIEHAMLQTMFDTFDVDAVVLDVARTPRNGPLQEFVATLAEVPDPSGLVRITREAFAAARPTLHHTPLVRGVEAVT